MSHVVNSADGPALFQISYNACKVIVKNSCHKNLGFLFVAKRLSLIFLHIISNVLYNTFENGHVTIIIIQCLVYLSTVLYIGV